MAMIAPPNAPGAVLLVKVFLVIFAVKTWLKGAILPWAEIPIAPPLPGPVAVAVLLLNVQLVTLIVPILPGEIGRAHV